MASIEIKNSEVIVRAVKERVEAQKRALQQAAADAAAEIVIRTQSGRDVEGAVFTPYTEPYEKRKAKSGRNTSPPDLTYTGNMLAAIQTDFEETSTGARARIFFNSALEAAKAAGNQLKRRFFGLSEEQAKQIAQTIREAK